MRDFSCTNEESESESDDDSENESDEEFYKGSYNSNGERHGRGSLYFGKNRQNKFQGRFKNGVKEGKGCFYFSDGSSLCGCFTNDSLNGKGVYSSPHDGSYEVSVYMDGELCGESKSYNEENFLTSKGCYRNNRRIGLWCFYSQYGGSLVGVVDSCGQLTGRNIVYKYPDNVTVLKGQFKNGDMVSATLAMYDGIGSEDNPHSYKKLNSEDVQFHPDISTRDRISTSPHLPDPYEVKRVYVDKSKVEDAGEGLFSRIIAAPGEVMSFYNGIRISHEEVDGRDWSENNNTISLDEKIVIDVPWNWSDTTNYCASLGHKANHSFQPNCKYARFDHPRFGKIKCIRTIEPVCCGDELTVSYGYDHTKLDTEAPTWYKQKLEWWINNKIEHLIDSRM